MTEKVIEQRLPPKPPRPDAYSSTTGALCVEACFAESELAGRLERPAPNTVLSPAAAPRKSMP
jgi:hypothetical protein